MGIERGDSECAQSRIGELLMRGEALVLVWSESSVVGAVSSWVAWGLERMGAREESIPSRVEVCRSLVVVSSTLILYYLFFGNRHWRRRRRLVKELQVANAELQYLQEKLRKESTVSGGGANDNKEIRIFMDGAFDLMHFGHMNAFRLAKSLGTRLVVGINSDRSITECKGAPLMNDEERLAMVKSCKFVDQVIPECPYIMDSNYLDWVIREHNIDYVVHGDDPCIVDGKDVYATAKESGRFRTIPRTEGVSTTDIVGRMLILTKEHHLHGESDNVLGGQSKFLTTSRLLQLFHADVRSPTKEMRVVYIDGAWDLFHPGHVAILKAAREVSKGFDRHGILVCSRNPMKRCQRSHHFLPFEARRLSHCWNS
jgi:ethanolamine-phosphate cytidylyltransferase